MRDRGRLAGYAIVFDSASRPIREPGVSRGDFIEYVTGGALDIAVATRFRGVWALHNHAVTQPLGTVDSGTLALRRDSVGLRFELPVNGLAPSSGLVYQRVRDGQGTGMSFGFRARADRWSLDRTGHPVRTVTSMRLLEVSVLTQPYLPAYPTTVLVAIAPRSELNPHIALAKAKSKVTLGMAA